METWYSNVPVVTRLHATGLLFVHVCVHFGLVDKYHLYFDPALVFHKHQFWRIITAFLYYGEGGGKIGFDFFSTFNITSKKVTILVWMFNIGVASMAYYYSFYGRFIALTFGILYHFLENVLPTWSISRGVRLFKSPDFV
ncbi:Derlin-2 [Linnemannia gamsii]|uniref:Derlin n=1 Tax=Linnemannia gamsii TaxID=64522 RepID=A0A9P6R9H5_9FUNG|nr:Derlin-2 [Linnemannia gamsii]